MKAFSKEDVYHLLFTNMLAQGVFLLKIIAIVGYSRVSNLRLAGIDFQDTINKS